MKIYLVDYGASIWWGVSTEDKNISLKGVVLDKKGTKPPFNTTTEWGKYRYYDHPSDATIHIINDTQVHDDSDKTNRPFMMVELKTHNREFPSYPHSSPFPPIPTNFQLRL
tara:strand:+ start:599 stop:931 length:333 start_codon:yes stop_codon:yes gene_type:complete